MSQSISALCVLAIIVFALLIMTNAVSFEQAIRGVGQAFALLIVTLWATCVLKGFVAVAVSVIKSLGVWIAILAFVIIGFAVLVRIISKVWLQLQNNSVKREEDYE